MKYRLPLLLAILITVTAAALTASFGGWFSSKPGSIPLSSRQASYLGVFEKGPPQTYQPVAGFTAAIGRQPNLVGYYGGWGEPFKTAFARTGHQHKAVTLLQWDPAGAPLTAIAAGHYDGYLRSFADSVRDFGQPVVIGFGHEMNAYWYSWGYGQTPAATFVAAWRHLVTLFRDQGTHNVTWLWTLQADEQGTGSIASWWPGASYVTWVGIDGYYYRPSDTFYSVFGPTIAQVRLFTGQPILLSEAAVGPAAGQAAKIPGLFAGMRQYGTLGLVWFDIAQDDGLYHQDWHLESNPAAMAAFRHAAAGLKLASP